VKASTKNRVRNAKRRIERRLDGAREDLRRPGLACRPGIRVRAGATGKGRLDGSAADAPPARVGPVGPTR